MDHYLDIKILSDPEFPAPMLMNVLFTKLHRVLVQLSSSDIGVSFPQIDEQRPSIGNMMRLHGHQASLQILREQDWLKGMRDHIELNDIAPVPNDAKHCQVKRVQAKSNAGRLRRRYQKRHPDVVDEEVERLIPDTVEKHLALPYLQLKSESTGQQFRLFLQHQPVQSPVTKGAFNCYGISSTATVPWF